MNTYKDNGQNTAPDARDFLGGNYLGKDDLDGPKVVTVEDVREEEVQGAQRRKLVVSFREFEKPLILNKTNIKRLASIFKTGDTGLWRGQVLLYVDEQVEYAGARVGGIRVQPAQAVTTAKSETQRLAENGGQVDWNFAA